eukprot:scaffold25994_cov30-Tisochrysis_lutea.AAC.4
MARTLQTRAPRLSRQGSCTFPTALAAPVVAGIMFSFDERPPRQSFLLGPSTVFCVAVAA